MKKFIYAYIRILVVSFLKSASLLFKEMSPWGSGGGGVCAPPWLRNNFGAKKCEKFHKFI